MDPRDQKNGVAVDIVKKIKKDVSQYRMIPWYILDDQHAREVIRMSLARNCHRLIPNHSGQ
jgi:ribosomal protein S25